MNVNWLGEWRNQYGSILRIDTAENGVVTGAFTTALEDSGFFGQTIPIHGVYDGPCIGVSGAGRSSAGSMAVSYTVLLRNGKLETMWFVVADASISAPSEGASAKRVKLPWWRSISTSADTFERL